MFRAYAHPGYLKGPKMHTCTGCNTLDMRDRIWHGLYAAWYDHREAGHMIRAHIFGYLADVVVR